MAPPRGEPRVAVIVPCYNDGAFVGGAVASVDEREPVEICVIDDGSRDAWTLDVLERLASDGIGIMRLEQNRGLPAARNAGLEATTAPYVFPLDADDEVVPGALARLADVLDAEPQVAVAYTDIEELTPQGPLIRETPPELDPFRVAYVNEMPLSALYRRSVVERLGGWLDPHPEITGYEDWDLWMSLAEQEARAVHVHDPPCAYRYRLYEPSRMMAATRRRHPELYRALRERHPRLFEALPEHRAASSIGPVRKALYPIVYGGRRRLAIERPIKRALDAAGIWTRRS